MVGRIQSPLSGEELRVFDAEFESLVKLHLKERSVVDIFMRNKPFIQQAAEIAKAEFKKSFDGVNAGSGEFGWSHIRPEHVLGKASAAGAINIRTWKNTITTSALNSATNGWIDWVGTSSSSNQMNKEAMVVVLGAVNFADAPKSSAMKVDTDDRKYPVWYMENGFKFDGLNIFEIPKPFLILPEGKVYIQNKYDVSGIDELGLLGITFAKGTYLLNTNPDLAA